MAHQTDALAGTVRGGDPQGVVEPVVREKVYNSPYWKASCFGLAADSLVDEATQLRCVGGLFGGASTPTPFLCLLVKLLQIAPERHVALEYARQGEYKYLRCLGAFYVRLVCSPAQVYEYLEPLLSDYRKVRVRTKGGLFKLSHVDKLVDSLLWNDYACDIALPRLPAHSVLERERMLSKRVSPLTGTTCDDDEQVEQEAQKRLPAPGDVPVDVQQLAAHEKEDDDGEERIAKAVKVEHEEREF
jgi:pre-mRNA-splicing factor 38A